MLPNASHRAIAYLIFGILLIVFNSSFAMSEEIRGVVTDAQTGNPLSSVNVMIKGTSMGAATDLEGKYVIRPVAPGSYTLIFRCLGFEVDSIEVQVNPGQTVRQDAKLVFKVLEGKEVIVTAQLQGQSGAVNRQLTAPSIISVVSAERIQELPDVNASESVGRLPGVSIVREGGEGQKVVIRGMAPAYNTVTIDGDKVPSSDLEDRSIDMSMISSDMLAGIEVIKAITPDRDADAFGGIVDFQISKAPNVEGFKTSFRLQSGYNGLQSEFGQYKNNFKLSHRFFDQAFGVLITGNMERSNRSADIYNASYALEREKYPEEKYAPILIKGLTLEDRHEILKRYGMSMMLDYQFDDGEILINNVLNRVNRVRTERSKEMDPGTNNNSVLKLSIADYSKDINTHSLAGSYRLDFAKIDARFSYNNAVQTHPRDMEFEFTENSAFDQIMYNQYKTTHGPDAIIMSAKNNYADAGIGWGYLNPRSSTETDMTAQGNIEIPYGFFSDIVGGSLKIGGKVYDKKRETYQNQFFERLYQSNNDWDEFERHHRRYGTPGFEWKTLSYSNMPSFLNYMDRHYTAGKFLNGAYDFGVGLDRDEMLHLANTYLIDSLYTQDELQGLDDFDMHERISAGYVMAQIKIGDWFTFLPGVRYEQSWVEMKSRSSNIQPEDVLVRGSTSDTMATNLYINWFPMYHLHIRPFDWFDFRFAKTKTISRPRMSYLNPATKKKASSTTVTRGRIDLKPQIADNYDVFLSFHGYELGLLTIGGFYKNIKDLIWQREGITVLNQDLSSGRFPADFRGTIVTQPENNVNDTQVRGLEFEWQTNFTWLPSPFDGIVLNANYSLIRSETRYPFSLLRRTGLFTQTRVDTFRTGPMPDQSDDIANVAVGYDKGGFMVRLSWLYQGRTLSNVGAREEIDGYTDALQRWDMMIKYKITEWTSVYYNWNNINDSSDKTYIQAIQFPDEREFYGSTMDIGIMLNF